MKNKGMREGVVLLSEWKVEGVSALSSLVNG